MLKLLNTKLLIAILAVLAVIASAAIYQRHEAAKAAAILEQQQRDAERRKEEDEAFRKKVDEQGAFATYMDSATLAKFVDQELATWSKVIKSADIKPD